MGGRSVGRGRLFSTIVRASHSSPSHATSIYFITGGVRQEPLPFRQQAGRGARRRARQQIARTKTHRHHHVCDVASAHCQGEFGNGGEGGGGGGKAGASEGGRRLTLFIYLHIHTHTRTRHPQPDYHASQETQRLISEPGKFACVWLMCVQFASCQDSPRPPPFSSPTLRGTQCPASTPRPTRTTSGISTS